LGLAHYFQNDFEEAYKFYNQAYELIKGSKFYERQAAALHNMAIIDHNKGNYKTAVSNNKKALKLRRQSGEEKMIALSLNTIGVNYTIIYDHQNAIQYYLKAFKIYNKINSTTGIIRSYSNIGQEYLNSDKPTEAIKYLKESLHLAEETEQEAWIAHSGAILGNCYSNLGKTEDAMKLMQRSADIYKKLNDVNGYSGTINSMASCYETMNNFAKALEYYEEALAISRKLKIQVRIAISLRNIGLLQVKLKNYSAAESSYDEGLKISEEINNQSIMSNFYKAKSWLFAAQNKFEDAYYNQQKYDEINDEIKEKEENDAIAKLKVEFDLELKEYEAEIHKLKNVTLVEANRKLAKSEKNLKKLTETLEQRVQDELMKRQEQQQQLIQKSKLESIGKLAAGIAHEINQPLGGISMGLENIYFAHTEGRLTEKYLDEKLKHIDGYFERIKQIIEHIRIFSRDQKSVLFEDVDINQSVKDALSLLRTQFANHNVKLLTNLQKNITATKGNKFKLEQVILNLLANAKDAVEEKQQTGTEDYKKHVSIKTFADEKQIYIEVEDNGNGISSENQKKIFDPFFTTKECAKGTGLGLSIIYGIIKEMNGEIEVESELGEFTRMRISFRK